MRQVEINSPEWFRAWQALKDEGHDRKDWMIMFADDNGWHFKHSLNRRYVTILYTTFQVAVMAQGYAAS